jgi:hypothetical protein
VPGATKATAFAVPTLSLCTSVSSRGQPSAMPHQSGRPVAQRGKHYTGSIGPRLRAERFVSPTDCLSRSGIATGSITFRSPWRKRWAWSSVAHSTRRPERCATWSRTIFSLCFLWWPWSRPWASTPLQSARRRWKCSLRCPPPRRSAARRTAAYEFQRQNR